MLEKIMEAGTGVYVLWGIGMLGLLLKIVADTYLRGLIKASENMATTKKRKLCTIRRKYENGRSLGINNGSGEAYAEKTVRSLKLISVPLEVWRRSGYTLCCIVVMIMSGSFWFEDPGWLSRDYIEAFLANGFLVCAFLLCIENIFLINNKMEILKANIRDYLENLSPVRCASQRRLASECKKGIKEESGKILMPELAVTSEGEIDYLGDTKSDDKSEIKSKREVNTVYNERDGNEELLNSFLKEFFT
ncbi:MAG: hypothetical protein E7258_09875 [Lachnospiraceae bacterium]|nr:hypothetical protein [Lachnospiraceae bacterium]